MGYRHIFQFPRGNKIYGFINVSDGWKAGINDSDYSHSYQKCLQTFKKDYLAANTIFNLTESQEEISRDSRRQWMFSILKTEASTKIRQMPSEIYLLTLINQRLIWIRKKVARRDET